MRRAVLGLALTITLFARSTLADDDDVERARTFFNAGAQAYAAAKYADAVRSFEQAYALAPRPQVLFSLAQSERKEFFNHGDVRLLRSAIQHYKEYLDQIESGGRRADALDAKIDLEGRLARIDPNQMGSISTTPEKRKPRVTVYSATEGARASIDDGPMQELPYFADLEPGKHHVRVSAEGYFDAEQEVSGDRGIDVPVNLPLKEKPALVTIALRTPAEVFVDGRLAATAPLRRPMEVPAGVHVISVVKNGAKVYAREVVLERGKELRMEPKLEASAQRIVALTMIGAGTLSLLGGGVAALSAVGAEGEAKRIEEAGRDRNLTEAELVEHNDYVTHRSNARTAAIVLSSIGGALLAGGTLLYLFDRPEIAVLPPRSNEPSSPRRPETPLDVTGGLRLRPFPILGQGLYGVGVFARF